MDVDAAAPPTYRSLCIDSGVKPNTALLKVLGGDTRELSMVKVVDLSRCYVGPKHILFIGRLIASGCLGELEVLDLSGNDVPSGFITLLTDALLSTPASLVPALRSVIARGVFLSRGDATTFLSALRVSPLITKVDFTGSEIAADVLESIAVQVELHVQQQYGAVAASVVVPPPRAKTVAASITSFTAFKEEVDSAPPRALVPVPSSTAKAATAMTVAAPKPTPGPTTIPLSAQIAEDVDWLTNYGDIELQEERLAELVAFAHLFEDEPQALAPPGKVSQSTFAITPSLVITSVPSTESSPGAAALEAAQEAPLPSTPGASVVVDTVPKYASTQETVRRLLRNTSLHANDARGEGEPGPALHVDVEFPPAPCSLVGTFRHPTSDAIADLVAGARVAAPFTMGGRKVSWRRLTEDPRCTTPKFYTGQPTVIKQGSIAATGWLCNAMRVINMSKCASAALAGLCVKGYVDLGIYTVALRKTDAIVNVVVDDYMPVDHETGEWLCTRSEDPNELWPSLVEKAMAKIHGGYDRLGCGSLRTGIMDLVGGAVTKTSWTLQSAKQAIRNGDLFEYLHRRVELSVGDTIQVSVPRAKGHLEQHAIRATGLLPNTAYLVDKTGQHGAVNLLRLRQPSPELIWQGRYGPDSPELAGSASLRQQLGWNNELRGRFFWITLEDYAAFFGNIYAVQWHVASDDHMRCVTAHQTLQWLQSQHSGPVDWDPLWMNSPTVGVRVQAKNTPVTVHFTAPDQRLKRHQPLTYPYSVQLLVLARPAPSNPPQADADSSASTPADSKSRQDTLGGTFGGTAAFADTPAPDRLYRDWDLNKDVVYKSPVTSTRDIVADVLMQPGIDYYVLIGFSGAAAVRYGLRITSLGRVASCVVEDNTAMTSLDWEWAAHSAGGAAFNAFLTSRVPPLPVAPTLRAAQNPQISLRVKREGVVTLVLALRGSALSRITFGTKLNNSSGGSLQDPLTPSRSVMLSSVNSMTSITSTGVNSLNIGFVVCRASAAMSSVDEISEKAIMATNFVNLQSVSLQLRLAAGVYMIVPCTYLSGVEVEFGMHAFAEVPLELKKASL